MTENEAKEMLQAKLTCMNLEDLACIEKGCSRNCDDCDYNYKQGARGEQKEAMGIAIGIFEEIQQYRALGTVEEPREAMEKQRAKKPVIKSWVPALCPSCRCELSESLGDGYYKHLTGLKVCPKCFQRLDWSGEE